jgi:hypothetical protein
VSEAGIKALAGVNAPAANPSKIRGLGKTRRSTTMKTRGSSAKRSAYLAAALFIPGLLLFALVHKGERGARRKAGEQAPVSASTPRANPELSHAQIAEAYGKLPLAFEKNLGQTNPQVQYLSHGQGYELFLTPKEAVLSLRHARAIKASPANRIAYARAVREANQTAKTSVVRMQFVGGNPEAEVTGLNKLARKTDYFVGNNPKDWRTDVPSYSRVEYRGVYPGVDAIFYGNQSRLEYDFVVAPGADPRTIALNVEGTRNLRVDARESGDEHRAGDDGIEKARRVSDGERGKERGCRELRAAWERPRGV